MHTIVLQLQQYCNTPTLVFVLYNIVVIASVVLIVNFKFLYLFPLPSPLYHYYSRSMIKE